MRLSLSSAAAPEARLDQLFEAAARCGFGAVELREGDGHGVARDDGPGITAAAAEASVARIGISGYRVLQPAHDLALARLSYTLGTPILLDGPKDPAGRLDRAVRMRRAGADVAVVLRGPSTSEAGTIIAAAGLSLAWDADPSLGAPDRELESLLRCAPHALRHIRLLGGGPEVAMQEGSGVDRLMRRLALAGYEGTLVLAPSTTRYRSEWQQWLGRRGRSTGCGSGRVAR
ncbi:MAG TPA: hypothetical protein VIQ27_12375 [Gemmatimonadales bacterium]